MVVLQHHPFDLQAFELLKHNPQVLGQIAQHLLVGLHLKGLGEASVIMLEV